MNPSNLAPTHTFVLPMAVVLTLFLLVAPAATEKLEQPRWYEDPLFGFGYPDVEGVDTNHRPAGKHGFVEVRGESLAFADGTPVKFWGVNLQAYALFRSGREAACKHAHRLAKLGVNLVRFHHMDSAWVKPNIFQNGADNTLILSMKSLDSIDLWVKCLKDEGIYLWFDFHVGRGFTVNDEIDGFLDASKGKNKSELKGFNYFNEDISKAMLSFTQKLLEHKNPYTNLQYKDEPAIIAGLITNENDLTHHFGNALLETKGVPQHHALYRKAAQDISSELNLDLGRSLQSWKMGDPKIFLNHSEYQFNRHMIGRLRESGFKPPIVTTSSWGGMGIVGLPSLSYGDIVDVHYYSDGNELTKDPNFNPGIQHWLAAAQVTGKPVSVSEWNLQPFPEESRHQLPTMLASLGALQGWDILILYGYAQAPLNRDNKGNNWTSYLDPSLMAVMPAASILFREGHVKGAEKHFRLGLPAEVFFDEPISPKNSISIRSLAEQSKFTVDVDYDQVLPWLGSPESCSPELVAKSKCEVIHSYERNHLAAGHSTVTSDTNEISRDWNKGLHLIETEKSVVISGSLGRNGKINVPPITVEIDNSSASVAVQALDQKPIGQSNRLLITAIGNSRPSDLRGLPYQIESLHGNISLKMEGEYRFRSLLNEGEAVQFKRLAADEYQIEFTSGMQSPWILAERIP